MSIPEAKAWNLSDVNDEARRARLSAEHTPSLLDAIVAQIASAGPDLRLGWERADEPPFGQRAVIQFRVSEDLFDRFMNGRDGYRARCSVNPQVGAAYNACLIKRVVEWLATHLPPLVQVEEIGKGFAMKGLVELPRDRIVSSLDANLSKAWMATMLIGETSEVALGLDRGRIVVPDREPWSMFMRSDHTAQLDIKGAFLGPDGPYQPKPPEERYQTLWERGRA